MKKALIKFLAIRKLAIRKLAIRKLAIRKLALGLCTIMLLIGFGALLLLTGCGISDSEKESDPENSEVIVENEGTSESENAEGNSETDAAPDVNYKTDAKTDTDKTDAKTDTDNTNGIGNGLDKAEINNSKDNSDEKNEENEENEGNEDQEESDSSWNDIRLNNCEIRAEYTDKIPRKANSFAAIIEAVNPLVGTKYNVYVTRRKDEYGYSPKMEGDKNAPTFGGVGAKIYDFDKDGAQELLYFYLMGTDIVGVMYEEKGDHVEAQAMTRMGYFESYYDNYNNEYLLVDNGEVYIINRNSSNLSLIADYASDYLEIWNYKDGAFYQNIDAYTYGTGDVSDEFVSAKKAVAKHISVNEKWLDDMGNVEINNYEKIFNIETTESDANYEDVQRICDGELNYLLAAVGEFK